MFCCRHFHCVRIEPTRKRRCIEFLTTQTDQSKCDILIDYVQKYFLPSRRRFCVFNTCCMGEQTRNHLENTEETLALNVSRMVPCFRIQATYLEDAEFASQKQKMFCFFPVCSLMQHCDQHWLKMFLQQCFVVCVGLTLNVHRRTLNSLRYSLDNKEIASLYVKQDKKNNNLTLSQLIQLHSLAYSRQPLFPRQVSNFMKALIFVRSQKMGGSVTGKIDIMFLIRKLRQRQKLRGNKMPWTQAKQGGQKVNPNRPANSYHSYDLTSQCLYSAHIRSVYVRLIFIEWFYVTTFDNKTSKLILQNQF